MTREEVIEFMQRDLDGDLSSEEQEALQLLLANSEEYQEIYAELKMLSVQLESLPKIEPPTSIVDSLLPVFDQIEKEKSESLKDNRNETHQHHRSPQMSEVEQSKYTVEEQSSVQKSGRVIPFTRKKFWIPSVIVAAAIMITILATNNSVLNPGTSTLEGDGGMSATLITDDNEFGILLESAPQDNQISSPVGEYQASELEGDRRIVIEQLGENVYTSSAWEEEWILSHMEWIDNDQLYYELVSNEQRKYFVIHIPEKREEELDSPYQHN